MVVVSRFDELIRAAFGNLAEGQALLDHAHFFDGHAGGHAGDVAPVSEPLGILPFLSGSTPLDRKCSEHIPDGGIADFFQVLRLGQGVQGFASHESAWLFDPLLGPGTFLFFSRLAFGLLLRCAVEGFLVQRSVKAALGTMRHVDCPRQAFNLVSKAAPGRRHVLAAGVGQGE